MTEQENKLATVEATPPSAIASVFGSSRGTFTSLDRSKREHQYCYMRCTNDCTGRIGELLNKEVAIEHVFAHKVELPNSETGEVAEITRLVLICPDLSTWECVSGGIAKDVLQLMDLFGQPPWSPPLVVVPTQVNLDGGKRMFKLKLAPEDKIAAAVGNNDESKKKGG